MLAYPFTEDEIWNIIREIPADKSSGPDGFTGHFYKTTWPIIKHDVIRSFHRAGSAGQYKFSSPEQLPRTDTQEVRPDNVE